MRPFFVFSLLPARPVEDSGAGAAGAGKRSREGSEGGDGDGSAAERRDGEVADLSPLQAAARELQALMLQTTNELGELVGLVNAHLKKGGYPSLHQKEIRDTKAYYWCGCREKGCFNVTFDFSAPKGGRKGGRKWRIKSISDHKCDPRELRGVAIANTWIPLDVKEQLVSLFDQNIGAADAYQQSVVFAAENEFPTTWEKSDVENFFDVMRRLFCREDVIEQLTALSDAGHFVAVDVRTRAGQTKSVQYGFCCIQVHAYAVSLVRLLCFHRRDLRQEQFAVAGGLFCRVVE